MLFFGSISGVWTIIYKFYKIASGCEHVTLYIYKYYWCQGINNQFYSYTSTA